MMLTSKLLNEIKPVYDYQEAIDLALKTWYSPGHSLHMGFHHPLGKLLGELGELLDDYMKSIYKPGYIFNPVDELGDIWYYLRILAYQGDVQFHLIEHITFPEIDIKIDFQSDKVDVIISAMMRMVSGNFLMKCDITGLFCNALYSAITEVCRRYNLTIDDLTHFNWEKLKPGSERGDEWMKARHG